MTKSAYFAKMFDGPFEEANAAVVSVDEEPALFVRVMEFLYLNEYTGTTCSTDVAASGHLQSSGIKDIYRERHPIFLHIDLFHFADAFTVTGLKQEAGKGFARHWFTALHPDQQQNPSTTFSDLDADVIKAVYDPPLTDSGLRDIVVLGEKCNMEAHQILGSVKYTDVIKAIPEFALDLIRRSLVRPQCRCFKCGSKQPVLWEKCTCGSWDDCGFYACISKLMEKTQCYKCGQFGFSYNPSQANVRTACLRRAGLSARGALPATYGAPGAGPYNPPNPYGNVTATGGGAGNLPNPYGSVTATGGGAGNLPNPYGNVTATGGIAGIAFPAGGTATAYYQGTPMGAGLAPGFGGQPGGINGHPPTMGNPQQAHAIPTGLPQMISIGVATVSPWGSDQASSDNNGSKQD